MRLKLLYFFVCLFICYTGIAQLPTGAVLWLSADKNVVRDTRKRVSEWADRTINGHSVFQLDSVYQPKWVKNVFGTKPAIFFDGVHGKYFMSNATSDLITPGGARTIFIMGLMDSLATDNGGGDFPSAGGTMLTFKRGGHIFAVQAARVNHSGAFGDYIYTAGNNTFSNAIANSKRYFNRSKQCLFIDVFISAGAGTYLRVRQNGNSVGVTQNATIVSDDGTTGFTIGDREDLIGQDWQGYIAEIIVYDRELNSTEIAQAESYLSTKYSQCFSLTSAITSNATISNSLKESLHIHPNPVISNLVIDGLPQTEPATLRITDIAGRLIMTAQVKAGTHTWNIASLKSGAYFLIVESNGDVISKKFVKE
jgi:hypothetical protein